MPAANVDLRIVQMATSRDPTYFDEDLWRQVAAPSPPGHQRPIGADVRAALGRPRRRPAFADLAPAD